MRYVYKLDKLGCASCAAKMETTIKKIDGVNDVKITFMTSRLTIDADESLIDEIEAEADKAIRRIESQVKMRRV